MKINILSFALIFNCFVFGQSNFSNGFSDGYKKGYCQNQGIGCISPLPPIAPTPKIAEKTNSYQDGYNRGFETGLNSQNSTNNDNNSTRKRFTAQSVELAKDNIYQGPDNSIVQQRLQLFDRLLKSAMQNVENENYDGALQDAEKLDRLGGVKESVYCIKSRVYTARNENPIEAYNYGIYAKSFCIGSDTEFEKEITENMVLYLVTLMINEDYKSLEIVCSNVWYENDLINRFKGYSYYYQNNYVQAKKYFKKINTNKNKEHKIYLESIENKTVLPNPFLK